MATTKTRPITSSNTPEWRAQEAEAAGFDTVFLMDHFYQLPGMGAPDEPILEAYTTLGR